MAEQVREPVQKRSKETKSKIILAAYDLFSEVGYFSTNTAEIAKRANVSTGIVYGYFKNKRDILLDVLDIYIDKAYKPLIDIISSASDVDMLDSYVDKILDEVLRLHRDNANMHEALNSLAHTDELVNARFKEVEDKMCLLLREKFSENGYDDYDLNERVHIAMNLIHSYASESVFDAHHYINQDIMRSLIKEVTLNLFKRK